MTRFANKTALVTGGASGIGRATVLRLAMEGAAVAIVDRDLRGATQLAEEIRAIQGQAIAVEANVADPQAVEAAVGAAVSAFGALHLAVNNAGISWEPKRTGEVDIADWRRVIGVNLDGVFFGLRYEIPAILAAGGGAIVNVASIYGSRALPHFSAYTAAKHGVVGLTRAAAVEYAGDPLRINALCPGIIDTPLVASGGDESAAIAAMVPSGRLGNPAEVAGAIAFLLSDDAAYVTAADLAVDGGLLR